MQKNEEKERVDMHIFSKKDKKKVKKGGSDDKIIVKSGKDDVRVYHKEMMLSSNLKQEK